MKNFTVVVLLLLAVFLEMGMAGSDSTLAVGDGLAPPSQVSTGSGPLRLAQGGQDGAGASFADVAAIIEKYHCTVCHVGAEPREGLRLDSYDNIMKGSKDSPVVVPGAPSKSELVQRVKGAKEPRMPMAGPPWLTEDEVKTLERWIAAGAKGPKS